MAYRKKSKKGVSIIVDYVLLIAFSAVIGIIAYNWLITYTPQEEINCPDGVSLVITNYTCSSELLTLNIVNDGKFDVGGYFIYGTDSPVEELATIDLSRNNTENYSIRTPTGVKFGLIGNKNSLTPGDSEKEVYDLTGRSQIYSIEIVPFRWQEKNNKEMLVTCKDVKIKKRVDCA
jgi:hypothetical protein